MASAGATWEWGGAMLQGAREGRSKTPGPAHHASDVLNNLIPTSYFRGTLFSREIETIETAAGSKSVPSQPLQLLTDHVLSLIHI